MQLKIESFVEPKAVPSVYACMDVLVSPYIRPATETFGLANIEAMAMRVPFIHFGTGGIQVPHLTVLVAFPFCFLCLFAFF